MENTEISSTPFSVEEKPSISQIQELIQTLPTAKNWDGTAIYLYKNCWYPAFGILGVLSFQQHFKAQDSDIILASMPKCGTTWLKALTFSIVNRNKYNNPLNESPLLTTCPHDLVRFLDIDYYRQTPPPNLDQLSQPRIFSVHTHYTSLPISIRASSCRIVYICRNPLDQFVSHFHFRRKFAQQNAGQLGSIEGGFHHICQGTQAFGPFWDNVLGYWNASLENPDKVLFLKYEDLKEDIISNLKKLGEFLGFPFSAEEEKRGVVEEISRLCSFESLKDSKASENKRLDPRATPNSFYFRKGDVGDWINYITPSMSERYKKIIEEKLAGSGLTFKMSP